MVVLSPSSTGFVRAVCDVGVVVIAIYICANAVAIGIADTGAGSRGSDTITAVVEQVIDTALSPSLQACPGCG